MCRSAGNICVLRVQGTFQGATFLYPPLFLFFYFIFFFSFSVHSSKAVRLAVLKGAEILMDYDVTHQYLKRMWMGPGWGPRHLLGGVALVTLVMPEARSSFRQRDRKCANLVWWTVRSSPRIRRTMGTCGYERPVTMSSWFTVWKSINSNYLKISKCLQAVIFFAVNSNRLNRMAYKVPRNGDCS